MHLYHSLQQKNHKENYTKLNSSNFVNLKEPSNNNSKKTNRTIDLEDHFYDTACDNGYERGSKGSRSSAFRDMEKIHITCLTNYKKGFGYQAKISFDWIAKKGRHSKRTSQNNVKLLKDFNMIDYEILPDHKTITTRDKIKQNILIKPNIKNIPDHHKNIREELLKIEESNAKHENKKNCTNEPENTDKPELLNRFNNANYASTYKEYIVQDLKKERDSDESNEILIEKAKRCIEREFKQIKPISCKNTFPLERNESEKAKEFRNDAMKLFGEDVYNVLFKDAEIFEYKYEDKRKYKKYGNQLIIKFPDYKHIYLFRMMYGIFSNLKNVLKRHNAIFGEYYQRLKPNIVEDKSFEDQETFYASQICALDESTEAKQLRHEFLYQFGYDAYAESLKLCSFELSEKSLMLIVPNPKIYNACMQIYEGWLYKQNIKEKNVILKQ